MNCCIDIGNTRIKIGIFSKENDLKYFEAKSKFSVNDFKSIFAKISFNKAIICNVTDKQPVWMNWLNKRAEVHFLGSKSKLPFFNNYKSINTLGFDRISVCAGAQSFFGKKNIVVFNAGTCLTVDFLNKGVYMGGSISPGIEMKLKAMHLYTSKLPLVKLNPNVEMTGAKTDESLQAGSIFGTANEIVGWMLRYEKQFSDVQFVLTGGNSSLLEKHLQKSIFVAPQLSLLGLNEILKLNT